MGVNNKNKVKSSFTYALEGIRDLGFHPNGQYILSAGYNNLVRCWNMRQKLSSIFVLDPKLGKCYCWYIRVTESNFSWFASFY